MKKNSEMIIVFQHCGFQKLTCESQLIAFLKILAVRSMTFQFFLC